MGGSKEEEDAILKQILETKDNAKRGFQLEVDFRISTRDTR
jgi:hypothetical protein